MVQHTPAVEAASVRKPLLQKETIPDLTESPNQSPASTLTEDEASALKESLFESNDLKERLNYAARGEGQSKSSFRRQFSCPSRLDEDSDFWKSL